jgi:cytochrome b subunit of formate dehydrogenase
MADQNLPDAPQDQNLPDAPKDQNLADPSQDQNRPDIAQDQVLPDVPQDQNQPNIHQDQIQQDVTLDEVINPESPISQVHSEEEKKGKYLRFSIPQRIEHIIFLVSFSILGITGLSQKFADSSLGLAILNGLGGIERTRLIHHLSAAVMMVISIYHVNEVLYKVYVERTPWSMLPFIQDFQHVIQDILYNLGFRKRRAYYGRYSYAEKAEYLALVWGTVIMGLTGFMMWNPITTARLLPGQIIPAAKAAHGAEAILAVLAIILWHFYHVHLKHFNKSMFIGTMTKEEMEHEHPAELAELEAEEGREPIAPSLIRRRQRVFFPFAGVLTIVLGFGVIRFLTVEKTAITTIPQGETAAVYVPVTPTARPTSAPTPTSNPDQPIGEDTWDGYFQALFRNRCDTCHGATMVGGLSLETYQSALQGGNNGPAIVPGDPDSSILVQMQSTGKHPGQLTLDELDRVINWIASGAPEK